MVDTVVKLIDSDVLFVFVFSENVDEDKTRHDHILQFPS